MRSIWLSAVLLTACGASDERALGPYDGRVVAAALDTCTPLTYQWQDGFLGGVATATVQTGPEGVCFYRSEMPGIFEMDCAFDAATRAAVAEDLRHMHGVEDLKNTVSFDGDKVVASYEVAGVTYADTMVIALNDGTCTSDPVE